MYNRLTGQIHLQPFSLADCSEFVTKKKLALQINQILELYMVIGGVPFYWNYVQKGFSTAQNVDHMFFEAEAPLKQEYDYLFSSLFRKPDDYLRIISALAGKKSGLTRTDIAQKTGLSPSGNLTRKLEELESCGFIRVYNGYEKKKKNSLYQLIDPFVLFYHHFLVKAPRDPAFWSHKLNTPALNVWNGLAFELVCLLHIDQIKKAMGISMIHTDVFSFLCKSNQDEGIFGSQIDLVIWRADRIINLVEMKYSSGPYIITKKLYESMQKKLHDFLVSTGTRDSVHLTMVTVHGIEGNAFAEGIQSQITAKDLFSR